MNSETTLNDIPPRWDIAAVRLASGSTVVDAAAAAGVTRRRVYAWLRQPAFNRRLQAIRDQVLSESIGRLVGSCAAAADTLRSLLDGADPRLQLSAARAIIAAAIKGREHVDGEARLREEEFAIEKIEKGRQL
jgi:hypothetical protein